MFFSQFFSEDDPTSTAVASTEEADSRNLFGNFGGFAGPVSSFYQLNMGLIGIGALMVVAIIGSRNFFVNYLYNPSYDYYPQYDHHAMNDYRRKWDEWYDKWYGDKRTDNPYDSEAYDKYDLSGYHNEHKRYRRSATDDVTTEEFLLKSLKDLDRDQCGFRLVCELGRMKRLTKVEKEVLKLIRFGDVKFDSLYPGKGLRRDSKELKEYQEALAKGRKKGQSCEKLYSSCSYSAKELMSAVGKIKRIF